MALIVQTNEIIGAPLSGISNYNTVGQAVFSIGWDYVFAAMNSNQLMGTLIKVDPSTGAPLEVLKTAHTIYADIPYANSWNAGNTMVSTTVDGVQCLYIRYRSWNPLNVYRGIWDDTLKQFKNFELFTTMSFNIAGGSYNSMARLNENAIRVMTDARNIFDFDIRSGETIRNNYIGGGSWSPSSYSFANSFVPQGDPTAIYGASGDGANWYAYSAYNLPISFNPSGVNPYAQGFNTIGTVHQIHPSTHHNVSYYTPNNGIITAYKNFGVYIQRQEGDASGSSGMYMKKGSSWVKVLE